MGDPKKADEYIFDLAAYLATSARGCVDEPHLYGPLRLIEALSRLVDLPNYASCLGQDTFLEDIKKQIDEGKTSVMYNSEQFIRLLDNLVTQFAREIKRRG